MSDNVGFDKWWLEMMLAEATHEPVRDLAHAAWNHQQEKLEKLQDEYDEYVVEMEPDELDNDDRLKG